MSITRRHGERPETRPLSPVRVAVRSDDRLFCEGLLRIIDAETSFVATEYHEGIARKIDVLLLDRRMTDALFLCESLSITAGPAVLFVAAPEDDDWAFDALRAGARGMLSMRARTEDLVNAVRAVHAGLMWVRRRVMVARIDQLAGTPAAPRFRGAALEQRLSSREREVFRQAATGLGNKELAGRLAISEATVKVHLTHIFQKLGVQGRAELAAAYHGITTAGNGLRSFSRRP